MIYNQATNSWIGPMTAMLHWCYEDEKGSCEDVSLLVSQISGTTELNGIDVVEIVQSIVIRIMRPPWLKEWSSITSANSSREEVIATAGGLGLSWLEIYLLHDQTCQMVRHPNVKSSQPHLYLECQWTQDWILEVVVYSTLGDSMPVHPSGRDTRQKDPISLDFCSFVDWEMCCFGLPVVR